MLREKSGKMTVVGGKVGEIRVLSVLKLIIIIIIAGQFLTRRNTREVTISNA